MISFSWASLLANQCANSMCDSIAMFLGQYIKELAVNLGWASQFTLMRYSQIQLKTQNEVSTLGDTWQKEIRGVLDGWCIATLFLRKSIKLFFFFLFEPIKLCITLMPSTPFIIHTLYDTFQNLILRPLGWKFQI